MNICSHCHHPYAGATPICPDCAERLSHVKRDEQRSRVTTDELDQYTREHPRMEDMGL